MVARLLRLRIALAVAPLRRGLRDSAIALLLRLLFLGAFAGLAIAPLWLSRGKETHLGQYDIAFGSIVLLAVFLIPLFAPKAILDVRSFQQVPISPPKLALSVLATSPATWTGLGIIVWLVTFVVLRRDIIEWNVVSVISVIAIAVTVPVLARFAGSLGALVCNSQSLANLQRGIGVLVCIAALPILALMTVSIIRSDDVQQITDTAQLMSWTPFGAAFATVHIVTEGIDAQILQLGVQIAAIAILTGATISLTTALLGRIERPSEGAVMSTSLGWFDYLPMTPAMSVGARSLTYWMRDPRYLVSLVAIPAIPVLVVAVLWFAGIGSSHLALIPLPLVLIMIGWMIHNDIATDSTALWIHVASGIRGVQDRFGRIVPVLVLGIPVLVIGTSITVVVMGNWQAFPAVLALGFVSLAASVAISSVASVLRPYPTSRPGESPFVQPAWQGAGSGLSQTIAFLGPVVLASPFLWILVAQSKIELSESLLLLAAALVYGAVLLTLGLWLGGAIFNRRSSELLAFAQTFD